MSTRTLPRTRRSAATRDELARDQQNASPDVSPDKTATCARCLFSAEHGWWGPGSRSHCSECHYEWNGLSEAHCCGCHRHFASTRAFDYHQGEDGCRDPQTVTRQDGRPRFVLGENADGREIWQAPRYDNRVRPWSRSAANVQGAEAEDAETSDDYSDGVFDEIFDEVFVEAGENDDD